MSPHNLNEVETDFNSFPARALVRFYFTWVNFLWILQNHNWYFLQTK